MVTTRATQTDPRHRLPDRHGSRTPSRSHAERCRSAESEVAPVLAVRPRGLVRAGRCPVLHLGYHRAKDIVASLSPEYATEVRDLILHPPDTPPYDSLREQLVKRTAASDQRRLQQLLHSEELGDRKPSQLLRRMQQLLPRTAHLYEVCSSNGCQPMYEWSSPPPLPPRVWRTSHTWPTVVEAAPHSSRPSAMAHPSPRRRQKYAQKFGDAARKCRPPCSKAGNDRAGR